MQRITIIGLSIAIALSAVVGVVGGRLLVDQFRNTDVAASKAVPAETGDHAAEIEAPTPEVELVSSELEPIEDTGSARMGALKFVDRFTRAHDSGDLDHLTSTLHPVIPAVFGEETCAGYTQSTMGSITDMQISQTGEPTQFTLPSPDGPIEFPEAIPVNAVWTVTATGETHDVLFHIVPTDDQLYWLTTCGWQQAS